MKECESKNQGGEQPISTRSRSNSSLYIKEILIGGNLDLDLLSLSLKTWKRHEMN
jgi:hypothetical protein